MKKTEKTIFNTLKQKTLSDRERSVMLSKLNEYRTFKPATAKTTDQLKKFSKAKQTHSGILSYMRPMPIVASLLIFTFVGAGTAAAAEGTIPGDLLYPIKAQVTENVRARLAVGDEARADFEAWRAERRLNETGKLVARAALTDKRKDGLEKRFVRHANQVETHIATIAQTDAVLAAELSIKFESTLAAHDAILSNIDATTTKSMRDVIGKNIDRIARIRVLATRNIGIAFNNAEMATDAAENNAPTTIQLTASEETLPRDPNFKNTDIDYSIAAKRMFVASEKTLVVTKELYKRKQNSLTDEQQKRVEEQLKKTTQIFSEAKAAYKNEMYEQAYADFKVVFSSMNGLLVFLKNNTYLDIEYQKIAPTDPIPLPVRIDLEYRPQIDPPSLELDAGPDDNTREKEVERRERKQP